MLVLIQSLKYVRGDISATFLGFPSRWSPKGCLAPAITSASAFKTEEREKVMPAILVWVVAKSKPKTKTCARLVYSAADSWKAEEEEQRVREGRKKRQEGLLRSLLPWVMGAQFHLDLQRGVCNASQKCTPERQGYLSTPEGGWSISPPGPVPH